MRLTNYIFWFILSDILYEERRVLLMDKETEKYSEQALLKKFNINNWKDLSIDQLGRFMALIPSTDPLVVCKIVEQFPDFYSYVSKMTDCLMLTYDRTVKSSDITTKAVCDGLLDSIDIAKALSQKQNLSEQEYVHIENILIDATNKLIQVDITNKDFLAHQSDKQHKSILALIGAGIGVFALGAIGGFCASSHNSKDNNTDIEDDDDSECDDIVE